jgi:hypothetical protein
LIPSSIAAAVLCAALAAAVQPGAAPSTDPPAAGQSASTSHDAELKRAQDTLADLLASEQIDRIDFEAETYHQAMAHIQVVVDTILARNTEGSQEITVFADQAGQVIKALDSHKPRGLILTIGKDVDRIPVLDPGEARMLGELVGKTVSLIREQYGKHQVSYYEMSARLFRSVILDVEEGPFLAQYLDGIQLIADQPAAKRGRYFR